MKHDLYFSTTRATGSFNMAASKSESVLAQKFDQCVADTLIKMGGGLATGVVFSLLLFKRKTWPVAMGFGWGAGMGYSNCQNSVNQPYLVMANRVKMITTQQENTENQLSDSQKIIQDEQTK